MLGPVMMLMQCLLLSRKVSLEMNMSPSSSRKLLGAKTLFATHYHELTELEGKMSNVNN